MARACSQDLGDRVIDAALFGASRDDPVSNVVGVANAAIISARIFTSNVITSTVHAAARIVFSTVGLIVCPSVVNAQD